MKEMYKDIAMRLKDLREIMEYTTEDMAGFTDMTNEEYLAMETGECDFGFTFLHKASKALNVDITDLIKGESPRLSTVSVVRAEEGFPITRRIGFDYQSMAFMFKNKIMEPFIVKVKFDEEAINKPISLSSHKGQEMDFIIEGQLKIIVNGHETILNKGDLVYYDSGKPHGMIATSKEGVTFLAVVADKEM